MSLINDALRRANQAKKEPPTQPSSDAPLRPVDPAGPARSSFFSTGLLFFMLALLPIVLFFWKGFSPDPSPPAPPSFAPKIIAPEPQIAPVVAPKPEPAPTATPPVLANLPSALPSETNLTAPVTNATTVSLPPLKLQGIFFRITNATAMINGKTVGVGGTAAGARLVKIDRQQVVVERAGQTSVLTME